MARSRAARSRIERIVPILMITPSVIAIAVFVYGFIGWTVYVSMTNWRGLAPSFQFVGLETYNQLFVGIFDLGRFRTDLVNNVFFTILFLGTCIVVGLLLAILLDQGIRGEGIFRTIYLFPMALSFVVTGVVWRWLFAPSSGINILPTLIGLEPLNFQWYIDNTKILTFYWPGLAPILVGLGMIVALGIGISLWSNQARRKYVPIPALAFLAGLIWFLAGGPQNSPNVPIPEEHGFHPALIAVVIAASWQLSGYTMAMYLAGLRGIPEELREAARVDGASEWQVYRHVVLPLLRPITLSAMIVLGHISLKIFDLVFTMAGDANMPTDMPGIYMFRSTFVGSEFARGAAIAVVMLIMVAVVIVPYLVYSTRREAEL